MAEMLVAGDDGADIAVHDLGGEGPVVLLVHAASLTASMFAPFARALSPRFHCLAPDLPGHGKSERPTGGDFSWTHLAQALCCVIDAIDQPIYGFGHSLGGTLLLVAAVRRPTRFHSLVVYEPVLVESSPAHRRAEEQALRSERRHERFDSAEALLERLSSKPPLDRLDADALSSYVRDGFERRSDGALHLVLSARDEARIYRESAKTNFEEELLGLTSPVTILIGGESPGAASLGATRLASLLPAASLSHLDGATHFAPLERPFEIAAFVERAFGTPGA